MLKFYLVTDTHIYNSEALGASSHLDQKCVNESAAIIDASFEYLAAKQDSDIVLIDGDLTNNGERASHSLMLKKLHKLKNSGKRVILITSTHDYGPHSPNETGDETDSYAFRNELRKMYKDFGYDEAIAEHKESMSYVVQLAPGYRLLALNDDGNGRSFCGYDENQLAWILEQIKKAHDEGQFIFAMTHHPVVPPTPVYPLVSKRDMLGDYENTSRILADAGMNFIFTGHTHMQNIGFVDTPSGNRLWDINTGSLVGYPLPIRAVTVDDCNMSIVTEHIETFDWDFGGKDTLTYMSDRFDALLNRIFDSMENDFDEFCHLANGFSVERKRIERFERLIKFAGRAINRVTLGGVGALLCCRSSIDKSVRRLPMRKLITELVRNIWSGNEHYGKDTPVGAAIFSIAKRLAPLLKAKLAGSGIADLPQFIISVIYDETPDTNAVLPLE